MSDAVMVPREAVSQIKARLMSYLFGACQPDHGSVFGWFDDHADEALEFALRDALAASTPVGGWEDISTAPKDGTMIITWCVHANAEHCEDAVADGYAGPVLAKWIDHNGGGFAWHGLAGQHTHWMPLPPPPSVSIDNGSRPQEAVPTGDAEPAVVDRRPFADVFAEAYGWTVDVDGYLAGLVAGDMGYDQTDLLLSDLLVDAQVAEDRRNRTIKGGPYSWPFHEALMAFVSTGHAARTQPADGCSSNDGAGGWTIWHGGPNPAPGQIVSAIWNGKEHDARLSDDLDWDWNDTSDPITAYRILPQTEKGS